MDKSIVFEALRIVFNELDKWGFLEVEHERVHPYRRRNHLTFQVVPMYRRITTRIRTQYKVNVSKEDVSKYQKILYPEEAEKRKARRLKRREYTVPGCNYMASGWL